MREARGLRGRARALGPEAVEARRLERGGARVRRRGEAWRGWRTWFSPKMYAGSKSMPWRSARRMKPSFGGKSATYG